MCAPAQDAEHSKRVGRIVRLLKNVLIQHNDGVGAEHQVALDGAALCRARAGDVFMRRFAGLNLFWNAGHADLKRDTGTLENLTAAGRLRGQDQHRPTS